MNPQAIKCKNKRLVIYVINLHISLLAHTHARGADFTTQNTNKSLFLSITSDLF